MNTLLPFMSATLSQVCFNKTIIKVVFGVLVFFHFLCSSASAQNLSESLQSALESSYGLQALHTNIDASVSREMQTRATEKPKLELRGNSGHVRDIGRVDTFLDRDGNFVSTRNRSFGALSLEASYNIFDGGLSKRSITKSELETQIARLDYQIERRALIDDIIDTHVKAITSLKILEIRERSRNTLEEALSVIVQQLDNGAVTKTDVEISKSLVKEALALENIARSEALIAKQNYTFKTGLQAYKLISPRRCPALSGLKTKDLRRLALENSLELKKAHIEEHVAQIELELAKDESNPIADAYANATAIEDSLFRSDSSIEIGVRLVIPLYSGGESRGKRQEAAVNMRVSALRRHDTEKKITLDTEVRAIRDMQETVILDSYRSRKAAAHEAHSAATEKLAEGLITISENFSFEERMSNADFDLLNRSELHQISHWQFINKLGLLEECQNYFE